jgi:nucleoside-diphosphate-sugar epimerase
VPNEAVQQDIERIVSDLRLPWAAMKDSAVLVTGATGLVGSFLVRTLRAASDRHGLNLYIIGNGKNQDKVQKLIDECRADFAIGTDICKPFPREVLPERVDYIFHCAAITKSAEMVAKPVDVITTAADGTRNMLDLAKERKCKGFLFLSSMEVYGQTELAEVRETDLGVIDLTNPRSSYPESKRFCESLCVAYAKQYGVPIKIARPAQTFGAGTSKDDLRVFAQFARSAVNGKDITLHTEGKSRGNYCYTADTVSGLLYVLLMGNACEAYNIANPEASATIREMAEMVAKEVGDSKIKVIVAIPKDIAERGYAPDVGYRLNADKLKALGWQPQYGLTDMYMRMIEDWSK